MKEKRIKPEIECFEPSHVHNALFFFEHYDFLVPPLHFSFVFGVMGGVRFNSDMVNSFIHADPARLDLAGHRRRPAVFPGGHGQRHSWRAYPRRAGGQCL